MRSSDQENESTGNAAQTEINIFSITDIDQFFFINITN